MEIEEPWVPKAGFNLGDLKHVYEKQEK